MSVSTTINNGTLRRRLTAEQKLAIVQASYEPGVLVAEVARKYNVGHSSLVKWRKHVTEGSLMSITNDQPAVSASEVKKLKKQLKRQEALLGKQSVQIDILREAIEIAREKKLISRQFLPGVDDIVSDS